MDKGPVFSIANKEAIALALGKCRTADEHAERMIEFFESSFGFNMSIVRRDPFRKHETEDFISIPLTSNPKADYRMVASTFNTSAKYTFIPRVFASWDVTTHRDTRGALIMIPAGMGAIYGMSRFMENGQEACVQFVSRKPIGGLVENGQNFIELSLYHKEWKEGRLTGFATFVDGILDFRHIWTFPATT